MTVDLSTARPGTRVKARNGGYGRIIATDIKGRRAIAIAYESGTIIPSERVDTVRPDGSWWGTGAQEHPFDIVAVVP